MIYIVREMNKTDNPADHGEEWKRFDNYEEAREYSNNLWLENKIKSYVSEEKE